MNPFWQDKKKTLFNMTPIATKGLNKNVEAFLLLITRTEGTDKQGTPYNELFGYDNFQSYEKHPNVLVVKNGYKSTAAGRYQILKKTFDTLKAKGVMKKFTPEEQDAGAIQLLKDCGAYPFIVKGDFVSAIKKANKVWASLPLSPYGQPTYTMNFAISFLRKYVTVARISAGVIIIFLGLFLLISKS